MKKTLLVAALVGVAFTSCVKNEESVSIEKQQQVTFEPAAYKAGSRAEVAFPTTEKFGAFAYLSSSTYDHTLFMDNEQVGYFEGINGASSYWATTETTYYWPESVGSHLDFICYFPYNADKTHAAVPQILDSDGQQTMSYNGFVVDAENPVDLMYADKAMTQTHNTGNYNNFTGVPTLFHHALAKLNFKVKTSKLQSIDGQTKWSTVVKSIKLDGIRTTGSVTLKTVNDHSKMTLVAWTNTNITTERPYDVWTTVNTVTTSKTWTFDQTLTVTAEDYQDKVNNIKATEYYVMPQAFIDGAQTLTIVYEVTTTTPGGHTGTKEHTTTIDFYDFTNDVKAWEMGKNITYTLQVDPEGNVIQFAPAVVDWVSIDGTIDI